MDIKEIKDKIKNKMNSIVDKINMNENIYINYKRLTIKKDGFHISFFIYHECFESANQVHLFFNSKDGKNIEIDNYYIIGYDKRYEFVNRKDDNDLFIKNLSSGATKFPNEDCGAKTIEEFFQFIVDFCESNHISNIVQPWVLSLDGIYNRNKKDTILNVLKDYYLKQNIQFDLNSILFKDIAKVIETCGYLIIKK